MAKGSLCLTLHAHLPFIHHPEFDDFLEEDWLYEAITETYIPLISIFDRLIDEGVDFRLTMSLTPSLCAMLNSPMLQERYSRHLHKLIDLIEKEVIAESYAEIGLEVADIKSLEEEDEKRLLEFITRINETELKEEVCLG